MTLLDGKTLAQQMRREIAMQIADMTAPGIRAPGLAVILAGDDPASRVYVRNKQKACAEVGITSMPHLLPADIDQDDLLDLVYKLNADPAVDGILLQLPLPQGLKRERCLGAIDPAKDVDGFHPLNVGKLALGLPCFVPCTPAGVMALLRRYDLCPGGKQAVVIGRSEIVGKPLTLLLGSREVNATVTLCHSGTSNLKEICLGADFLFVAIGRPGAITGDMVSPGTVVVDIGISRTPSGLMGDVDFATVAPKARAITPVPGGIGPMTVTMLLRNTVQAWAEHILPLV